MNKHTDKYAGSTPGPWRVLPEESDKPYIRIRGTRLGLRYKVANVIAPNYEGALPCESEETRANALLIADAPTLAAENALLRASRDELVQALEEIEAIENREWKPMRVFRSDEQVARDEARHDLACEIAGIARAALASSTDKPEQQTE
jgi:hypothetical protein